MPEPGTDPVVRWIRSLDARQVPPAVRERASWLLLDLLGVACAGSQTALARIARGHAAAFFGAGDGRGARLLLDGRRCSMLGAAWAGAALIDSYDAHDGHALTKGHAGVVLLPALLALCEAGRRIDGAAFMASLVLGYEVATRAGIGLHADSPQYQFSGAWNALGVAAMASHVLALDSGRAAEALGIADYHAPRGLMMHGIDHPTMVKDGAGPGALAGLQAALLAREGFTGAPSWTVGAGQAVWADLGQRWCLLEQYVKPHPVCRWAQPAIEAAASLQARHGVQAPAIRRVVVETFAAATRLAHAAPSTTEQAQYSLPFPLAAWLVHGDLGPQRIGGAGLSDADVLALAGRIELRVDPLFEAQFPARRQARLRLQLHDGKELLSDTHEPRGEPGDPLPQREMLDKFRGLAAPVLGGGSQHVADAVLGLWDASANEVQALLTLLHAPRGARAVPW